jgi:hypothetical protein
MDRETSATGTHARVAHVSPKRNHSAKRVQIVDIEAISLFPTKYVDKKAGECSRSLSGTSKRFLGVERCTKARAQDYASGMPTPSEYDLPDSFILTYLEYKGIPFKQGPQPFEPQDDDSLRILIEPIHPDPALAKKEELLITFRELREMQDQWKENRLNLVTELSGEPGVSAGEIKLGRRLLEKIRREQQKRRGEKPGSKS